MGTFYLLLKSRMPPYLTDISAMVKSKKKRSAPKPTFKDLADQLEERCKASNLTIERGVDEDDEEFVRVQIPNGRETRDRDFWEIERLTRFLDVSFEKYVFLGDYTAITSYNDSYIEAILQTRSTRPGGSLARVFGVVPIDEDVVDEPIRIVDDDSASVCEIVVGECSDDLFGLGGIPAFPRGQRRWSLQITGIDVSTHDEALNVLERVSNSLFFQIDLERNIAMSLRRERRHRQRLGMGRRSAEEHSDLQFPKVEYDDAPITLYWYARSAIGMPLLQFLAYYQCVEFYYPTYSQSEARRRIRNVLKDPTFRADRDTDLMKVLSVFGTGPRGIADERSMLRATIRECVSEVQIRDYFERSEECREIFSTKTKGLTDCKIPIANANADLRDDVADRIYDLRCKIVHTKTGSGDDSVELLLPYSKGAELILHDVELLRFVAQQVLIASSSALKL